MLDHFRGYPDGVVLPRHHLRERCWHPHLHAGRVPDATVARLDEWHARTHRAAGPGEAFVGMVPFCVFGGRPSSRYAHAHHAGGTHAVCRKCGGVKAFPEGSGEAWPAQAFCPCGKEFARGDYYQPVFEGCPVPERLRCTPRSDRRLAIAETLAAAKGGLEPTLVAPAIAWLAGQGLLRTAVLFSDCRTASDVVSAMLGVEWQHCADWFEWTGQADRLRVKPRSLALSTLTARGLMPTGAARQALKRFLRLPGERQRADAQESLDRWARTGKDGAAKANPHAATTAEP
jgi:hypothetical protein